MSATNGDADRAAVAEAVRESVMESGYTHEPRGLAALAEPVAADEADDDSPPSAEDLASIDANPGAKSVYRSLVRQGKEAMARLTQREEEAANARQAIEAVRRDPRGAVKLMAEAAGMRVADEPTIADRVHADLAKSIGREAADLLAPAIIQSVEALTGEFVAPYKQAQEQQQYAATHAGLKAEVAGFAQRVVEEGGEWGPDVEQEMVALVPKFPPAPGVTVPEYLEILHAHVMTKRGRGRRAPRKESSERIRPGMDPKAAARAAVAAARRELE